MTELMKLPAEYFLVGARVRITGGPHAGSTGLVVTPPHPKLTGYRTVELTRDRTLHRIGTEFLERMTAEETPMNAIESKEQPQQTEQQSSEVERLAAEVAEGDEKTMADLLALLPKRDWRIDSIESADWALEQMADAERELEELARLEAAAIKRIKERTASLARPHENRRAYFEAQLRSYAESNRTSLLGKGKKKSKGFPNGTIGWREKKPQLVIRDKETVLAWALEREHEYPHFIRRDPELAWAEVKKHFAPGTEDVNGETGEATPRTPPPGTEVEPGGETFYAKTAGEE